MDGRLIVRLRANDDRRRAREVEATAVAVRRGHRPARAGRRRLRPRRPSAIAPPPSSSRRA
ncbi:hypothetical protein ACU686_21935 [Yinghuangia aomiensis]